MDDLLQTSLIGINRFLTSKIQMIRIFRHYISAVYFFLVVIEICIFFASIYLGYWFRFPQHPEWPETLLLPATVLSITFLVCATSMGLYQRTTDYKSAGVHLRILAGFLIGAVVMSLFFYTFPTYFVGRGAFGYALLVALFGVIIIRLIFYRAVDQENLKRRVLIVGSGTNAAKVLALENSPLCQNFQVVAGIRMAGETSVLPENRIIDLNIPLNEYAIEHDLDEIVVAPDDRRQSLAVDEILDCKMNGFEIVDLLTFFEREAGMIKVDSLQPSWLVFSDGFRIGGMQTILKRLFDIVASLTLLALIWPIMLITALAILIECRFKSPIFYKQVRVGLNWQLFEVIKFRSMQTDAEKNGAVQMQEGQDDRITRVGMFIRTCRIDELPQLINVLKGEMSFVGPRPERPEFVETYAESIPFYSERHRVKPGITGWAQLCYPYGAGLEDAIQKLQYDLYYVKNYSLFLDLMILVQTIEVVLWGKGAR